VTENGNSRLVPNLWTLARVRRSFRRRNRPTARCVLWGSSIVSGRGLAVLALADPCSVSDDPQIARPRLKAIHCQGDSIGGRTGRPAIAHTVDLAGSLEVVQPGKCLVFVQAGGARDHRRRKRVGHLAQRGSQPIPTRLRLVVLSFRLRRQDRRRIGRSRFGLRCGLTSYRRIVAETRSASAAQDDRLTSGRADHVKPAPSAPRATDAAATPPHSTSITSCPFIGSRRSS